MNIQRYNTAEVARWDAFVAASRNGNLFHTRRFLSYHPRDRFTDHSLVFFDGPNIVAVLPAAVVREGDGKTLLASHPGASYGGLVLSGVAGMKETEECIDAILDHAKHEGFAGIRFLRLPPATIRSMPSDDQEYWLYQKGFRMEKCELDSSVCLAKWGQSPNQEKGTVPISLTGKCRNMVRQAERAGVMVKQSDDFASYWRLLESVLEARHKAKPTHTIEEILRLHALFPEHFRLFAAFLENRMIGGIVAITLHTGAVYTLYMAQDYEYQKHHPLHAVLAFLLGHCGSEGRRVLHLGVSTEEGGTVVNKGLFFFKESFGAGHVRRESWTITF